MHSNLSIGSRRSKASKASEESTPLLSRQVHDEHVLYNTAPANGQASPAAVSLQSIQDNLDSHGKGQRRWTSIISLSILSVVVIAILGLGFAAPAIVEEYVKEALLVEPTSISINSITETGVWARIKADFVLDSSRVEKKSVRDLGRAGAWIARQVESGDSKVEVYLSEYGNLLLGTANIPPVKVDIRDRHYNHLDFLAELKPGDEKGLRRIANDWLDGIMGSLAVKGIASIPLKSGIFKLGTQTVSQSILFKGQSPPSVTQIHLEGFD